MTCLAFVLGGCSEPDSGERLSTESSDRQRLRLCDRYFQATERNPRDAESWYRWGVTLLELGLPKHAYLKFQKALGVDPENAQCLTFAGHAEFARGGFGSAYIYYREAATHGAKVDGVLSHVRDRMADLVKHNHQLPALGGVVAISAHETRQACLKWATALHAPGEPVDLRAVDRCILNDLSRLRETSQKSFLLYYASETARGFQLEEKDWKESAIRALQTLGWAPAQYRVESSSSEKRDGASGKTDSGELVITLTEGSAQEKSYRAKVGDVGELLALVGKLGRRSSIQDPLTAVSDGIDDWVVLLPPAMLAVIEQAGSR